MRTPVSARQIKGEAELRKFMEKRKKTDVEHFLKKNAIEFIKKNQFVTYLVFSNDEGQLIGYFSIALKPLTVRGET